MLLANLFEAAPADQVKGTEKARTIKPRPMAGSQPHPFQGRLVGGESKEMKIDEIKKSESEFNFDERDLHRLQQSNSFADIKSMAKELISTRSKKPMLPQKIAYFDRAIDSKQTPAEVIKLMWDLLLSGEGSGVLGSRYSTKPSSYRKAFGEEADQIGEDFDDIVGSYAELGRMKANKEIDDLKKKGLPPYDPSSSSIVPTPIKPSISNIKEDEVNEDTFNTAFGNARTRGDTTFTWTNPRTGKTGEYSTLRAGETNDQWQAQMSRNRGEPLSRDARPGGYAPASPWEDEIIAGTRLPSASGYTTDGQPYVDPKLQQDVARVAAQMAPRPSYAKPENWTSGALTDPNDVGDMIRPNIPGGFVPKPTDFDSSAAALKKAGLLDPYADAPQTFAKEDREIRLESKIAELLNHPKLWEAAFKGKKLVREDKKPWEKKNPAKTHKKLSPSQKAEAKKYAREHGQPYPSWAANAHALKKG